MTIKLHVGYVGKTRDGKRVDIVDSRGSYRFPWMGGNSMTYTDRGMVLHDVERNDDIIAPWVDAPRPTTTTANGTDGTAANAPCILRLWLMFA